MIIDAKRGKPNPAHTAQVMIYQYAVRKAPERYQRTEFSQFKYPIGQVGIPLSGLDEEFADRLGSLIGRLASETPARRVPSAVECRWCDITADDCPEWVEREDHDREGTTEDLYAATIETADSWPLIGPHPFRQNGRGSHRQPPREIGTWKPLPSP